MTEYSDYILTIMETRQTMKTEIYDAPVMSVVELDVEGVLCASAPPYYDGEDSIFPR